jgi:hypothetical protein
MNSKLNFKVKNGNFLISVLVKSYFQGGKRVVFCSLAAESFYLKSEPNESLMEISPTMYQGVLVTEMQHHYYYIYINMRYIYIYLSCLL